MRTETDQFIIDKIQWAYAQSREITGDPDAAPGTSARGRREYGRRV